MGVEFNLWSVRSYEAEKPSETKRFFNSLVKIAFTLGAYYTAVKTIEFVHENGLDGFRDLAHNTVQQGLKDIEEGRYLASWSKSLPARVSFAGDALVQTALLPMSLIQAAFHTVEVIFTWGGTATRFEESASSLLENANRIFRAAVGAIISPNVSYNGRDKNFIGIFLKALAACAPDGYSYNSRIGWTSHYSFGRRYYY